MYGPPSSRPRRERDRRGPRTPHQRQFRDWLADRDLPGQVILAVGILVLLTALLALIVLSQRRPEPLPEEASAVPAPATVASARTVSGAATPQPTPVGGERIFQIGRPATATPPPAPESTPTPQATPTPTPSPTATPPSPTPDAETGATPAPDRESTPPPPRLTTATAALTFVGNERMKTVTLQNAGSGQIMWRATPQQAWILVSPSGGTLADSAILQIWIDREVAERGRHTGTATVSSDAGTVVITVTIE